MRKVLFYSVCVLVGASTGCAAAQAALAKRGAATPGEPSTVHTIEVHFTEPVTIGGDNPEQLFVCGALGNQFKCIDYLRFQAILEAQRKEQAPKAGTEL